MSSEYFIVGGEVSNDRFTAIESDLVNKDTGEDIDLFREDPDLVAAQAITTNEKVLSDLLLCYGTWFVISDAAWNVLQSLKVCESIRWIETDVCRKNGEIIGHYKLAYGAREHEVWDYDRSNCQWHEPSIPGGKRQPGLMLEGVINLGKVPENDDFFRRGTTGMDRL